MYVVVFMCGMYVYVYVANGKRGERKDSDGRENGLFCYSSNQLTGSQEEPGVANVSIAILPSSRPCALVPLLVSLYPCIHNKRFVGP